MKENYRAIAWKSIGITFLVLFSQGGCSGDADSEGRSAQLDVEAKITGLLDMSPGVERTYAYSSLLRSLDVGQLQRVADAFEVQTYPPVPQDELKLLFDAWARIDPQSAFDEALGGLKSTRKTALGEVLRVWAETNPAASLLALETLAKIEPSIRMLLADDLAAGWLRHDDWDGLPNFLTSLPPTWEGERVIRDMVEQMRDRQSDAETMRWAATLANETLGERQLKRIVYRKVALVLGPDDPQAVARWLEPLANVRYGEAAISVLCRVWAHQAPIAALKWARALPKGSGREWGVQFAFERWYQDDQPASVEWLLTEDPENTLDVAAAFVVRQRGAGGPSEWDPFLQRISDPDRREDTIVSAAKRWIRVEPEAASAWLDESPLPDSKRAKVRAHAPKQKR
jgi:hypothetical protein